MRIGLDGYPLTRITTGVGRYVASLLQGIISIDRENEYYIYLPKLPLHNLAARNLTFRFIKGPLSYSPTFWLRYQARQNLIQDRIAIFWGTQGILPFWFPREIKAVVTVYDMISKICPETMNWDNRVIFPLFFAPSLKRADKIVAISHTTRNDIENYFPKFGPKIEVAACGKEEKWLPNKSSNVESERILAKYNISRQGYILTVSTIEPRKNLDNLLKAYAELKKRRAFCYPLLIVGKYGWNSEGIYALCRSLGLKSNEVIFTGHVPDDELLILYQLARLFVSVSLYEGFGLPLVEAMACNIPAVVSDIPAYREVLDESALFVNPLVAHDIAQGIDKVCHDQELSQKLIYAGSERSKLFSWHASATKMLDIFNSLCRCVSH